MDFFKKGHKKKIEGQKKYIPGKLFNQFAKTY